MFFLSHEKMFTMLVSVNSKIGYSKSGPNRVCDKENDGGSIFKIQM